MFHLDFFNCHVDFNSKAVTGSGYPSSAKGWRSPACKTAPFKGSMFSDPRLEMCAIEPYYDFFAGFRRKSTFRGPGSI